MDRSTSMWVNLISILIFSCAIVINLAYGASIAGDISGAGVIAGDISGAGVIAGDIRDVSITSPSGITGGDYTIGGSIIGADVIAGDIRNVSITSPSGKDESWLRQNGGWIQIVNSIKAADFCQYDCNPKGRCRCYPATSSYHGIYIASVDFTDKQLGAYWRPPLSWTFSVGEMSPAQTEPNIGKIWVPAGSYLLVEYLFQSEINPGIIDYMPCTHWLIRPAKVYQVAPGSTVIFEDLAVSSSDISCTLNFARGPALVKASYLEDARVYEYSYLNWDNANWGGWDFLALKSNVDGIPNTRGRIYAWFDVTAIPSKYQTYRFLLRLVHWPTEQYGNTTANVYRITEPWEAGNGTYHPGQQEPDARGAISWNKQPSVDTDKVWASQELYPSSSVYTVYWDITDLVNGWIFGKFPNYGLAIIGKGEGNASYSHILCSSEMYNQSLRAAIVMAEPRREPRNISSSTIPMSGMGGAALNATKAGATAAGLQQASGMGDAALQAAKGGATAL